ncbi:la-related protein 6B isoform X1 [Helianthus annuus]|uniref:la-related protein 6B isoform X1 n=1 Tax=Helianthus annuus TaxID=4232 RepID=UPI000B903DA9|nr:la-related protein 6B isoform X1 [Helianthus annuus]
MAQEPSSSSSSSQTLESPISTSISTDNNNQSLIRNVSFSRLNAKAPEFVPRTTTAAASSSAVSAAVTSSTSDLSQPRLVISPPPTSPGIIHVYPSPNSPFHAPIPTHVPVTVPVPVQSHHGHHHHHPHHHVAIQYHHHQQHNHTHQRQFNGGGTGYLDQKDVSVSQRAVHGDLEVKDGLTDEATQKIVNQVEYYFSDINLATTDHLMRFINKDPEGYVPISVVVAFKKIKALVSSNAQLASILRNSGKLVVSEDGKKVKRLHPLTEPDMEELQSRIIVAENLPDDHCHQNLMKIFSAVGSVKTIRTCQPQASNGGATSASRAAKADGILFSNKLHAFVEYETIESAEKAALELNKEGNWRHGLRVRLLRRPSQAKPAQTRGKKAGQEDDAVPKEDDTSTSEQHSVNEKHVDDTCQQSDVQSHEHVQVEDHPNDKEGGHKKGRNRGRGKGRGRPQYNHHNNRGTHMVTPPSANHVNAEHPVIGKQPPGPRMPDGTRGFSLGRGKPVGVPVDSSVS